MLDHIRPKSLFHGLFSPLSTEATRPPEVLFSFEQLTGGWTSSAPGAALLAAAGAFAAACLYHGQLEGPSVTDSVIATASFYLLVAGVPSMMVYSEAGMIAMPALFYAAAVAYLACGKGAVGPGPANTNIQIKTKFVCICIFV